MASVKSFPLKRTFLCALFLFACSPPEQSPDSALAEPSSTSELSTNKTSHDQTSRAINTPLLTVNELLNAQDVKDSLAIAARQNDHQAFLSWQKILIAAAVEVDLPATDINLLSGKQGLIFLKFQGMKTNYKVAFDQAFLEFKDLDKVYSQYPAFKDMHKQSKTLVEQRDALIESVAAQLDKNGFEGDSRAEAKRQWRNYMKNMQQSQAEQITSPQ